MVGEESTTFGGGSADPAVLVPADRPRRRLGSVDARIARQEDRERLPVPSRLSTVTEPPCMSTIERTIARPSPLPLPRASLAREPR